MRHRDGKATPLVELADRVAELTEPYVHAERYFDQAQRKIRLHVRKMPSLLDQLRAAAEPSSATIAGPELERRPGGFESRAAANVDAADKLRVIGEQLGRWLGVRRVANHRLEVGLRQLVGIAATTDTERAAADARRWWTWCRILAGWQDPPWRPHAPCPTCGSTPGGERGLRVRLDIEWAYCVSCESTWDGGDIHDLATYIRGRTWDRSMTVEIIEWLREQLAEDEEVAMAATPGPWQVSDRGEVVTVRLYGTTGYEEPLPITQDSEGIQPSLREEDAAHVARHNSARVLADVAAKRRILDDFATLTDNPDRLEDAALHLTWTLLGTVVRMLAKPYADQPGYDDEWHA